MVTRKPSEYARSLPTVIKLKTVMRPYESSCRLLQKTVKVTPVQRAPVSVRQSLYK